MNTGPVQHVKRADQVGMPALILILEEQGPLCFLSLYWHVLSSPSPGQHNMPHVFVPPGQPKS